MVRRRARQIRGGEHAPGLSRARAGREDRNAAAEAVRRSIRSRSRGAAIGEGSSMNRILRPAEIMAETEIDSITGCLDGQTSCIDPEHLRMAEAILFAAAAPVEETTLSA